MGDNAGLFAAGVALSICISSFNSLGMGLQKKVHKSLSLGDEGTKKKYYQDSRWIIGLICMSIASIGSLGNYALLGQSRASAMASITIVTNAVMARYMLNEVLRWFDIGVIALIMVGVTIAVVYGSTAGSPRSTLDDIIKLLSRDTVYIAVGLIIAYAIAAETFVRGAEKRGKTGKKTQLEAKMECFVRAFTAGLFSGSTGFFAKAVVTSVESMAASKSPADLTKWQFWLFLIGLPSSIVLQLRALNSGLRYFDATDVVPIYQSSIIFWGVTSGWVFYNENSALSDTAEAMFAVGCFISVLGILMLLAKKKPVSHGEVPPDMAESTKLSLTHGSTVAYQKLDEEAPFTPMAPYAGAPAITTTTGIMGAEPPKTAKHLSQKPSFSVGRAGATAGKLSESTPLTSPRHGAMPGGVPTDALGSGPVLTERAGLVGLMRADTVRDLSVRLLQPAHDTHSEGTDLVRRRADTSTGVAILNALDAFAPGLGHAITGEGVPSATAAVAGAVSVAIEMATRTRSGSLVGTGSRNGSVDLGHPATAGTLVGSAVESVKDGASNLGRNISAGISRMSSVANLRGSSTAAASASAASVDRGSVGLGREVSGFHVDRSGAGPSSAGAGAAAGDSSGSVVAAHASSSSGVSVAGASGQQYWVAGGAELPGTPRAGRPSTPGLGPTSAKQSPK